MNAAAMLAFREDYTGDWVPVLMAGILTMVHARPLRERTIFILDDLNEKL